jgi:hypothetical protein
MRDVDVVVLSRFPEIFEGFKKCVDEDAPEILKHVIWDSHGSLVIPELSPPWDETWPHEDFQMARFGNFALRSAMPRTDVLYCGDDTRIIEPNTIKRLQELAHSDLSVGILSPKVHGLCAMEPMSDRFLQFVGFVFIYIKREVIDKVGYLDERFTGYGMEDIDYCYRVRKAGFMIGVARDITIEHGVNGNVYGSTFIKVIGERQMGLDNLENLKIFAQKWGLDPDDTAGIFTAIRDLSATERK